MRKNWLLLLLATILVSNHYDVYGQQQKREKYKNKANDPVTQLPYYKKLRWADDLFKSGSYFSAIEYYEQLKQEQERNPYLTYQLAECYWMTRDYVPAAHYFGEVFALAPKLYPEATFKEAMMLKMAGQYDLAIAQFNKFIADNPKTFKKLKQRAKREIDGANMAKGSMSNPQPVNVLNAGPNVNSAYTELSPYPLGDTALLFATMRQNSVVNVEKKNRDEYVSRFMVSRKQENVPVADSFQWALKFADGKFNDPRQHVGNGSYSPGGDRFYFTKCSEEDSMKVICKIYVSHFKGAAWTEPELLGDGINDGGSNTQPFVGKVGKKEILFFSSNRILQSRGGYDIWYSIIDPRNGTYRRPQNAGKQINTEADEVTPYYDSRVHKLYFSSNGWVTMGGFDVYSADGGPSRYSNVTNLGYPINTSADELYFIKDPVGKPDAYLVSNRIGSIALKNPTCCDDIWRVQYEPRLMVTGKVVDCESKQEVSDVVVKMVDETGQMKTYNSTDGSFGFNMGRGHSYVVTADKQGFSSTRATVNTSDVKRSDPDDTANVTICLSAIVNSFRVSNVYYDYDKATLRPESVASLDSLINFMKDNPSLSVEIYSFTDGKGADQYNKSLSERRAQAVKSYLVNNGVEDSRMIVKGFGKKMPAAPNTSSSGTDNPTGRQLNRRTEFRIVTDVPTRRVIFNSAKPGSMNEQEKNLMQDENNNPDNEPTDNESEAGKPGSRVNKH
ncbi:MAG: OmpA family protein [Bacteroidetes bacterium]|nr:OmpA family protein [Bacteroidota bacterium]MBS1776317.1 OmpA family protein [Bacteroidota bacterium]